MVFFHDIDSAHPNRVADYGLSVTFPAMDATSLKWIGLGTMFG